MKHKCLICNFQIIRKTQLYCRKHSPYNKGEFHYEWKGENAGYFSIHKWIEKQLGKAKEKECLHCGNKSNLTWANTNHEYKRKIADWIVLCKKCHFKYDKQDLRKRDWHGRLI